MCVWPGTQLRADEARWARAGCVTFSLHPPVSARSGQAEVPLLVAHAHRQRADREGVQDALLVAVAPRQVVVDCHDGLHQHCHVTQVPQRQKKRCHRCRRPRQPDVRAGHCHRCALQPRHSCRSELRRHAGRRHCIICMLSTHARQGHVHQQLHSDDGCAARNAHSHSTQPAVQHRRLAAAAAAGQCEVGGNATGREHHTVVTGPTVICVQLYLHCCQIGLCGGIRRLHTHTAQPSHLHTRTCDAAQRPTCASRQHILWQGRSTQQWDPRKGRQ